MSTDDGKLARAIALIIENVIALNTFAVAYHDGEDLEDRVITNLHGFEPKLERAMDSILSVDRGAPFKATLIRTEAQES